jgi:hypothetical protein
MLVPAKAGLTVAEYAPNVVKKTVVGAGHGEKTQIRMMIGVLLPKADPKSEDAADALAIASVTRTIDQRGAAVRGSGVRASGDGNMIGKLKGIVDSYGEDYVILDVGGVGYQVHCSARTMQALPSPSEAATLSIETHVREDQIKLFGLTSDIEREWFRLLQTVQGVGAKVAMSVLGTLKAIRTRFGGCRARQGHGGPYSGRGPESGGAHRHRDEGQGAGLREYRSSGGASCRCA